jgi:gliding motility-associated-like protein
MTYGTTYYVSAIAGNDDGNGNVDLADPCLSVSSPSTPVVFRIIPVAVLSGDASICEGESTNLMVQLTGQGPWTLEYEDGTGSPSITVTANNSPFNIPVSPTATATYQLLNVSNAFCTGTVSGTATVTVNNPPTVANVDWTCDGTGQNYTVSFDIQGGDPSSYVVTPSGTLAGSSFTSNPISNGTTYSFQVDDANGCGPTPVNGAFDCNCTTDAGTMSATQISVCVNENAVANTALNPALDGNDILVYVLHTGSSNVLGTVLATSTTPDFSFIAGQMTPGTVYYISAVAGNDNGNGGVNTNDPCFNVAVGTPVVFNALPNATLTGTATICEGQTAQFTGTVTGVGPFVVDFTINTIPQTITVPTPGTFQLPPVNVTTVVSLTGITDNGTGCSNAATSSATITVSPNVTAGTSIGDLTFCQNAAPTFDLDDQLTGADPGGQWTGPNGVVPNGQVNPTGLAAGTYTYTYTVQGIGNCPDDTEDVNLILNGAATADAGADQTLTCDVTSVPLGGSNTTPGATYSWTGGTVANPGNAVTSTSQSGTYTLLVTTTGGCTAQDQVQVNASASMPGLSIVISDVSCFGNSDGTVSVDSVWGGTAPYVFSLNNAPFSANTQFSNLGQGQYVIQVMDAGGCEAESAFSVTQPDEVTVQIVGNFQGSNNVIDLGDELILSILSTPPSSELDSILWSSAGLDSCNTCTEITVSPTSQTNYTVLVSENGCEATDGITVFVEKNRPVYVPNVFSPNDDGINDIFTIYAGKSVTNIKSFVVFSRWGETMYSHGSFTPNDPTVGWDGKHRGKEMQPAVFTWYAEIEFVDGRTELYKGDVSLVR